MPYEGRIKKLGEKKYLKRRAKEILQG